MKNIHNHENCVRRMFQLNRLHPEHDWGQVPVGAAFNLIATFSGIADRLELDARLIAGDAKYKEALGEDLQASQYRRTAEQLRCQARRMRREAGTAVWPNAFHNVVDLSDARPVAAQ